MQVFLLTLTKHDIKSYYELKDLNTHVFKSKEEALQLLAEEFGIVPTQDLSTIAKELLKKYGLVMCFQERILFESDKILTCKNCGNKLLFQ